MNAESSKFAIKLEGGAANKIFDLTGESHVLAIYPFWLSRHIRHTPKAMCGKTACTV
jgi:hypothetical protein